MNSNEVYKAWQLIMLENQAGLADPDEFCGYVNHAQMKYFNSLLPGKDSSQRAIEALVPFREPLPVTRTNNSAFPLPTDYSFADLRVRYYVNPASGECSNDEIPGVLKYSSVKIKTDNDFTLSTTDLIDKPSFMFPVGCFEAAGVQVLPTTIKRVEFIYHRNPATFYWGRSLGPSGIDEYDPADPADQGLEWMLKDCYTIIEMALALRGITVREGQLIQALGGVNQ